MAPASLKVKLKGAQILSQSLVLVIQRILQHPPQLQKHPIRKIKMKRSLKRKTIKIKNQATPRIAVAKDNFQPKSATKLPKIASTKALKYIFNIHVTSPAFKRSTKK